MSLEKELQFFKENQALLLEKYNGKILVIKDKKVVGVYDSEIDAYSESKDKFELGTFLIQKCIPGEESFTQTYFSRYVNA